MRIRSGESTDAEAIVRFQQAMAQETEGLELDPVAVTAGVRAVFDRPARGRYFVADEGGEVVGCALVQEEWSDWRNCAWWWVHSVYVEPRHRGRGVYRELYQFLQTEAAKQSIAGVRLYVDKRNRAAQSVYARLGMTNEHYGMFEWQPTA